MVDMTQQVEKPQKQTVGDLFQCLRIENIRSELVASPLPQPENKAGRQWPLIIPDAPLGKPKKNFCITSLISDMLVMPANQFVQPVTWHEKIAVGILQKAVEGDAQIIKGLIDRLEGKVPTPIEASGPEGGPIEVNAKGKVLHLLAIYAARSNECLPNPQNP